MDNLNRINYLTSGRKAFLCLNQKKNEYKMIRPTVIGLIELQGNQRPMAMKQPMASGRRTRQGVGHHLLFCLFCGICVCLVPPSTSGRSEPNSVNKKKTQYHPMKPSKTWYKTQKKLGTAQQHLGKLGKTRYDPCHL